MLTNELKKGDRILLANGWTGTIRDNVKGNIRMAEIEGIYTETGSIYAHDIVSACKAGTQCGWCAVEHTPAQIKLRAVCAAF